MDFPQLGEWLSRSPASAPRGRSERQKTVFKISAQSIAKVLEKLVAKVNITSSKVKFIRFKEILRNIPSKSVTMVARKVRKRH